MRTYTPVLLSLAIASGPVMAQVAEEEVNHPAPAAQALKMSGADVVVEAALGNGGAGDLDYYVFKGKAGDVVTVDIDRGIGGMKSVDTVLAVFDPSRGNAVIGWNDDAYPLDPGSTSSSDARIDGLVLPADGEYVIGVSNYPRYFTNGGVVTGTTAREGDYVMTISGVSKEEAPFIPVALDIKPGSEISPVNPKSKGKIPVALLGREDLNVNDIDQESLTFGAKGDERSLFKCTSVKDVNHDGYADLLCHFENQQAGFGPGDAEGKLEGRTTSGRTLMGSGFLKVVPKKVNR